ncbi:translocation protein SEC63 homolog isoform X2 [Tubulanus polymorphus]|uniref:translocation protein SEC63 homolog isoform X2 n=1 Tax=Tubulanus polymorphus TaxID=672921 RepID=UPI003DA376A2
MAGMQFEYDEKGGTFYYFLLSFYALILIPATYYLWPRKEDSQDKKQCHCQNCKNKAQLLTSKKTTLKRKVIKIGLVIGWIVLVLLAYKVSQVEMDYVEYDPFIELGIDRGASTSEIRRAYRKLSLVYHPDKETGDPKKFMRIAKAYAALTDEESRKNWEEYGNPDGPGATHFGIALPKWIVEKQNSLWVLAMYGLVFMVILPVVVGTWWYRSIKYSGDQVLLDTTQLYYYFFHKTPNMVLKRVIMILAGSLEFGKGHNNEIVERPTDNEEIPALMRELPHLEEKKKERPLCYPYSVKARALLHAHFSRLELPPKTLELDQQYMLKKCPYLVNEMVNIVAQLVALAHAGRAIHVPRLETIENCMKLSQMIIQATWDNKSPLLQLPHINDDFLRHFHTKKRNIRSIKQFVSLNEDERRALLRNLPEDDYRDVLNVCCSMPYLSMGVTTEVLDDDDNTITAGSIVTVTVELIRKSLKELFNNVEMGRKEDERQAMKKNEENGDEKNVTDSPVRKSKGWEKNKNKKASKGANKKKKKPAAVKAVQRKSTPVTVGPMASEEPEKDSRENTPKNERICKTKKAKDSDLEDEGSDITDGTDSENEDSENESCATKNPDEEEDWSKFQEEMKKETILETKSKESHLVHCPYFPAEKYEWWWIYVADRKNHQLITAPVQVCSLKDREEVQLKFSAPQKVGIFQYSVCVRSDSYLDFDLSEMIKLDVKEARKVESHPQWEISDEEEDKDGESGSDSDDMDDDDDDDDDDSDDDYE